jgi:hypothetical protein
MRYYLTQLYIFIGLYVNAQFPLMPISGADSEFEIVNIAGKSVHRSKVSSGNFAPCRWLFCADRYI